MPGLSPLESGLAEDLTAWNISLLVEPALEVDRLGVEGFAEEQERRR